MSFCPECGTKCVDGSAFCRNCGSSLSSSPAWQQPAPIVDAVPVVESAPVVEPTPVVDTPVYQQPVYQQPTYQQPVYQQPVYQQPTYQQPVYQQPIPAAPTAAPAAPAAEMPTASKVLSIIALVCGILSLPMSIAYGSGLFFGIAAIIMGNIAGNKAAEVGLTNGKANTGKKLGIAGTIVSGVLLFIIIIALVAAGEAINYGYSYYY